jgi:hypothetical protein
VEFEPDAEVIPEEPIAVNVEKKKSDKKEKVTLSSSMSLK